MKKLLSACTVLMILLTFASTAFAADKVSKEGYFRDIKLCGRVKIVEYGADIKVKTVSAFPDLRVKVVSAFPEEIGEWQFVEYGEDFTVQFVDSFPDIKIKYVNAFPGVN